MDNSKEILFQKETILNDKQVLIIIDEDTLKELKDIDKFFNCTTSSCIIMRRDNDNYTLSKVQYSFKLNNSKDKIIITASIEIDDNKTTSSISKTIDSDKFYNIVYDYLFVKQSLIDEKEFLVDVYDKLIISLLKDNNIICYRFEYNGIGFIYKDDECIATCDKIKINDNKYEDVFNIIFDQCVGNIMDINTNSSLFNLEFYTLNKVIKINFKTYYDHVSYDDGEYDFTKNIVGALEHNDIKNNLLIQDSDKKIDYKKYDNVCEELIEDRTKFFDLKKISIDIDDDFIL